MAEGRKQPLLELLGGPPVVIMNIHGKEFICAAEVKRLLTHQAISAWIKDHPLHRPGDGGDIGVHDQDLVERIVNNCRLLFAILIAEALEYLTFALLSNKQNDDSLPQINYESLSLDRDEQQRLDQRCQYVAPILRQSPHVQLSQEVVLPFTSWKLDVGSGSFGQIACAEVAEGHLEGYDKKIVAVKVERLVASDDEEIYLREVETLRNREHPNIIPLLASYTLKKSESSLNITYLHFVFPLAEMDLADWMTMHQPPDWLQDLSQGERRQSLYHFIYALVSGLAFLHREKDGKITAHHDLKPKNILVLGKELKIADFGRSHLRTVAEGSETQGVSGLGTYDYSPPEYWKDDGSPAGIKHGRAFDIWSMGCIIVELATLIVHGWESQKTTDFRDQRKSNTRGNRPELAKQHEPDLSFHNNQVVVREWIYQLQIDDGSPKLRATLNVALQMINQTRDSRLYAWEAELDLYRIQEPDGTRLTRLEKGSLAVQPPPLRGKIWNGTQTPLHRAAQKGDLERICQLSEAGWSLYVQDHEGWTTWDVAKRTQKSYFCEWLHASLDLKAPEESANEEQGRKLLQAAVCGDVDKVRTLLSRGVNAMFVNEDNRSALYKAAENNQSGVAESLLEAKGKELLRQKERFWRDTPLHKAASTGHVKVMEKMLARFPDLEDQQKQRKTALWLAVEWGHDEAVDVLLNHGAQVFTQQETGGTPLHGAAKGNKLQILKRLLEAPHAEKCLEHKNKTGDTPLWLALFHGHVECADVLLDRGASLHVANKDSMNILHVVVRKGLYDFLKRNIGKFNDAEFNSRNRWGDTPLTIAQREQKHRFIALLRDRA